MILWHQHGCRFRPTEHSRLNMEDVKNAKKKNMGRRPSVDCLPILSNMADIKESPLSLLVAYFKMMKTKQFFILGYQVTNKKDKHENSVLFFPIRSPLNINVFI